MATLADHEKAERRDAELILIGKIGDQKIYAHPDEVDLAEKRKVYREAIRSPYLAAVIALQIKGYTRKEIAGLLGIHVTTVHKILYKARKFGGLNDVTDRMDLEAVPLAVENLIDGLHKGNETYTLKTLEGRGVLKQHQQVKQEGGAQAPTALVVKFEDAQGNSVQIASGSIVGAPRQISAAESTEGD